MIGNMGQKSFDQIQKEIKRALPHTQFDVHRFMKEFGRYIRAQREEMNLSTYDVSRLTGIPRTSIQSYERGDAFPRMPYLYLLYWGIDLDINLMFSRLRYRGIKRKCKCCMGTGYEED
jgi:DNA-binding transcriptional regulator YiaG